MHIPPLFRASDVPSLDLEQQLKCMCGHQRRLGDCLVTWTQPVGNNEQGWYCVCDRTCYTRNVTSSLDVSP